MQIAALETVLAMHAIGPRGRAAGPPDAPRARSTTCRKRAHRLAESLDGDLEGAHVRKCQSVVGGGSMPGTSMPSWGVAREDAPIPAAFAARLRAGSPSVFCRVEPDAVVFDVRTVIPDELPDLARAIQYALEGDDFDED